MAYYIATVKVQDENERGRITNTNEVYCVEADPNAVLQKGDPV